MPFVHYPDAFKPWPTLCYMFVALCLYRPLYVIRNHLLIEGRENIPEGPFVVVSNHLSNWDPALVSIALHRPVSYLAKKELYDIPVLKQLILFFGTIYVDRKKPDLSTFKAVKHVFECPPWVLGLFIEGTLTKTPGILGTPHDGPAYFARSNKLPILPIGVTGTDQTYGKYHARIGKPFMPDSDLETTTWKIMEALADLTGFKLPPRNDTSS